MNTKGISDDRTQQEIRHSKHGRTEEQEKIFKKQKQKDQNSRNKKDHE